MFKGKRALVAGGTGFLGGALARGLLDRGASVRATCHSREPGFSHPNLEWMHVDLEDQEACHQAVEGMDFVLMCAATTSGASDIVKRPLVHLTPNVVMNARMLEAAYGAKVQKFLFLGSTAAYPPHGDVPLKEDDMFSGEPADVYYVVGWMKRYAEILCSAYANKLKPPMATAVVRPGNVYGPGDKFDWEHSHVTAALIRRVVERHDPIEVWGDGKSRRDLIFVDDFVEGTLRALAYDAPFLCVNIAGGKTYSIAEILETAIEVDGFENADVRYDPSRPQTIDVLTIDTQRAAEKLDFRAQVPLAEGIRRTMDWLRSEKLA